MTPAPQFQYPRVLSIAGSDSGGGAGIQADLKTIAALGCYGMTAVTALTAQNTTGVRGIHGVPLEMLADQIDAVVEDIGVDAVKIGMLHSAETVRTVAAAIERHRLQRVVLDPVMIATSGAVLIGESAISVLVRELFPKALVITPNLDEAALLVGRPLGNEADMEAAARQLLEMGAPAVLVKGGHLTGDIVSDLLLERAGDAVLDARRHASTRRTRMAPAARCRARSRRTWRSAPRCRRRCSGRASTCAARCRPVRTCAPAPAAGRSITRGRRRPCTCGRSREACHECVERHRRNRCQPARLHRAGRLQRRRVRRAGAARVRAPARPQRAVPALLPGARRHPAQGQGLARHSGGADRRLQGPDAQLRAAGRLRARVHDQRHDPRRAERPQLASGSFGVERFLPRQFRAPLHARDRPHPHGHPVSRRGGDAQFVAGALPAVRGAGVRRAGQRAFRRRARAGHRRRHRSAGAGRSAAASRTRCWARATASCT